MTWCKDYLQINHSLKHIAEVQKEVERIYELAKSLNMVVIDCDVINHPSQLTDCSLAPISIYIKMEPQILEKLVKLRGSKRKNLGAQVVAAQKLAQCNEVSNSLKLYVQRNSFVTQRYRFVTQRYRFVTQRYMFVTHTTRSWHNASCS